MTINIIKLSVGCESVETLAAFQKQRLALGRGIGDPRLYHGTRMVPKRQAELLDGGSIYWVIKGLIQVRQRLVDIEMATREDGSSVCLFILDPKLVPVRPTPRRPFQGWRYLQPDDAPDDLIDGAGDEVAQMSPAMRRELAELGLL